MPSVKDGVSVLVVCIINGGCELVLLSAAESNIV